ncbi:MAG TPA: YceD family protein [Pyrinomonadaceae bacterium]|nr:YceD family protein [Pyrinomonadaceae bacterium]
MRIELENLEGGKGDFAHVYLPDDLNPVDERISLSGPATVSGKVRLAGNEVFVNGHVETRAQVECDRCLQPVEIPVNADFALEYITGSEYESSGVAELTEEEMSVAVFDGKALDVDEIVKEQILLAVPTRMLCREDCKGICPECGTDRNTGDCNCATNDTDPRWAALKKLI